MADRCSATIIIPTHLIPTAGELLNPDEFDYVTTNPEGTTCFEASEVAWGTFDIEGELDELGIPFDVEFGASWDWTSGTRYYRPGKPPIEINEGPQIELDELNAIIGNNTHNDAALGQAFRDFVSAHVAAIPQPLSDFIPAESIAKGA